MIYFITGSSGVGKSTLVKELKTILPETFIVHDFDELGVPLDADTTWRIGRTKEWIQIAKENSSKGISTIVIGLVHPNEVNEVAEREHVEVKYIMLEVEQEELKRRLMALRFSTPERIRNLQKYEGVSVDAFLENNQRHVEQIQSEAKNRGALFVDTTYLSPQEVAQHILALLR